MKLELVDVTKTYGSNTALSGINFSLEEGVTALLGPNGAGKTTLLNALSTLHKPDTGSIVFNTKDILQHPQEMRKSLGYLPQYFGVYDQLTASEFLLYLSSLKGIKRSSAQKRIGELLESLNLLANDKRKLKEYSGGMRQRVGIAQALLNDPDVLILDEPTVGLDPDERINFKKLLADLSAERIILISTHIVSDIEAIAHKIAIMNRGKLLVNNEPQTILNHIADKVWLTEIPHHSFSEFSEHHCVCNAIRKSDTMEVRLIHNGAPTENSSQVSPCLEDAYLFYTNQVAMEAK